MTIDNTAIIYESPDRGETVFARLAGSLDRYTVSERPKIDYLVRWYAWKEILNAAQGNVALDDLIKKAEEVYALVKDSP